MKALLLIATCAALVLGIPAQRALAESGDGPSVYVAIYEVSCGVTTPDSRCAAVITDSLLSWGVPVYLGTELPVATTVPEELRERIFGDKAAASASLSATVGVAGGFSIESETLVTNWADYDLWKWPWRLDEKALLKMAKEKGTTHLMIGEARAEPVKVDLSESGMGELVSTRGSLSARLMAVKGGMLSGNFREEVSQVASNCTLGAAKCFEFLGAKAAAKLHDPVVD